MWIWVPVDMGSCGCGFMWVLVSVYVLVGTCKLDVNVAGLLGQILGTVLNEQAIGNFI